MGILNQENITLQCRGFSCGKSKLCVKKYRSNRNKGKYGYIECHTDDRYEPKCCRKSGDILQFNLKVGMKNHHMLFVVHFRFKYPYITYLRISQVTFSCSPKSWPKIRDLLLSINASMMAPNSDRIVDIPAMANVHPSAFNPLWPSVSFR